MKSEIQQLPTRISSNYIVFHGTQLVMVCKKQFRDIDILADTQDPNLGAYYSVFKNVLERGFAAWDKIFIEKINDEPAFKSEYKHSLKAFGFKETYKGLEIWRSVRGIL